jgi:hypothetical protein
VCLDRQFLLACKTGYKIELCGINKHLSSIFCIMERIEELFTILRTLVNSTTESTIAINKCTLSTVITCLQVTHKKIDMFKLQNKLLSDELSFLRHQQCDFNKHNDIKDENEDA